VLLAGCASGPGGDVFERGRASWYGERFEGRRTASGERFDMRAFTAAHRTLPFGTLVRVRSVANGREVTVRINDRGPHVAGRIIDLSHAAAKAIGMVEAGQMDVELRARPAAGR
jgi:rare lipoprotein A